MDKGREQLKVALKNRKYARNKHDCCYVCAVMLEPQY